MKTSKIEINHLILSWLAISLAFAIARREDFLDFSNMPKNFLFALITAGLGFLIHELAHKVVAQNYGAFAEYRANMKMLFVTVGLSFLWLVLAAPGAVYISGRISKSQSGKISLAGPLSNLILAAIFLILAVFSTGWIKELSSFGLFINAWIGAFNLIPVGPFDGVGIKQWSKRVFYTTVGFAVLFLAISNFV